MKIETKLSHEDMMWRIIEFVHWGDYAHNSNDYIDFQTMGAQLKSVFLQEALVQADVFYRAKLNEIKTILEDHAEKQCGNRHGYYGLGDDGFWDLRAHIIGLGKEFYQSVIGDPEIAKCIADNETYVENFGYVFSYAIPNTVRSLTKSQSPDTPAESEE